LAALLADCRAMATKDDLSIAVTGNIDFLNR
jgi:hypothetical protein